MLSCKGKKTIVGGKQISDNHITIIIAVNIFNTVNGIGFMLGKHRHNRWILTKQQNCCKSNTFSACIGIRENQSGTAKKLFIRHGQPRMISVAASCHLPCSVDDIRTKGVWSDIRINLIDKVGALFTGIKLVNQVRIIGNIHIRVVVTVIDSPTAATNLCAWRYMNTDNQFVIVFHIFRLNIKRREDFIRIIDWGNKIFLNLVSAGTINAENRTVIFYTEKNISAVSVWKRAYGFVNILRNVRCGFFEFNCSALAFGKNVWQFFLCHSGYPPFGLDIISAFDSGVMSLAYWIEPQE